MGAGGLSSAWLTPTRVVARRQFLMLVRSPIRVVFGFTQPLIYVLFFGPFIGSVYPKGDAGRPGGLDVLVPGLLLQLTVFSAGFSGYATLQERREGVLDRQRVSAAAPGSLLCGRSLANATVTAVQAAVITVCALPLGFRCSIGGALLGIALIFLLNLGVSVGSSALAYRLADETTFTPIVQNVSLPVVILSGVLLPLTLAPGWLRRIAFFNPLSHAVDALRAAYAGRFDDPVLWTGGLTAVTLSALLTVAGVWSFTRAEA